MNARWQGKAAVLPIGRCEGSSGHAVVRNYELLSPRPRPHRQEISRGAPCVTPGHSRDTVLGARLGRGVGLPVAVRHCTNYARTCARRRGDAPCNPRRSSPQRSNAGEGHRRTASLRLPLLAPPCALLAPAARASLRLPLAETGVAPHAPRATLGPWTVRAPADAPVQRLSERNFPGAPTLAWAVSHDS